ncbi:MAG: diacylglycerol kinase family lipid kinase [Firmicutes bacterium]|nr:diacylglycerol kinase family lipid kinase [Dethiobacter sp.]MBS3888850.1 diacylglycerol kinase family lipid kinase [Bacillota bacterium]MBS4054945.1 diacylglycerol kinase family lipid kinase [Thermaerobacter sp.]
MRIALIVNRSAGHGQCGRKYTHVAEYFKSAGLDFTPLFTEGPGHATALAKQAVHDGYEAVVSMGGDGTLNEVVNGLAGSSAILGFIPAGSGNDFGRTFGLKLQDIVTACQVIVKGKVQEIDVGQIGERRFINIAGAGLDAEVGLMANVWGKKYFRGYTAYVASILRQLFSFKPQEITIELDHTTIKTKAWFVAIANARFFGGGLMIAPHADLNDGLFDVCIVKDLAKLELIKMIPKVFKGDHIHHRAVEIHRSRRVYLSASSKMATQADGEVLGTLPREFCIAPNKQKVFLP